MKRSIGASGASFLITSDARLFCSLSLSIHTFPFLRVHTSLCLCACGSLSQASMRTGVFNPTSLLLSCSSLIIAPSPRLLAVLGISADYDIGFLLSAGSATIGPPREFSKRILKLPYSYFPVLRLVSLNLDVSAHTIHGGNDRPRQG